MSSPGEHQLYRTGDSNLLSPIRLGLNIDDIVSDFALGIFKVAGVPYDLYKYILTYDYRPVITDFKSILNEVKDDRQFWLDLEPLEKSIPDCCTHYLTARYCPDSITKEWILRNNLPALPIVNVNHVRCGTPRDLSKTDKLIELGLDGLVDDKDKHFMDASSVKPNSFLVSRPWNRNVQTNNRIYRLEELDWRT